MFYFYRNIHGGVKRLSRLPGEIANVVVELFRLTWLFAQLGLVVFIGFFAVLAVTVPLAYCVNWLFKRVVCFVSPPHRW